MSTKYVAYFRVSTTKQGISGLGLEAQVTAVQNFVDLAGGTIIEKLTEVESGRKTDRPRLDEALALCRKHKAILIIAKLDRLARNVEFVANLMNSNVDFVACDLPHANRLTIHVMAAVAEHEREVISQRTIAALKAAKARGVVLGNPLKGAQLADFRRKRTLAREALEGALIPAIKEIQKAGTHTFAGIARELNARGFKTVMGRAWDKGKVSRYLGYQMDKEAVA